MRRHSVSLSQPVVIAAAGVMLALAAVSVVYRLAAGSDGTRPGYVTTSLNQEGLEVARLPEADTPLADGDLVVAIEGVPLETWVLADRQRHGVSTSDTVAYEIRRGGSDREVAVPLRPYPLGAVLLESWGTLAFCVATLSVASYVYARRPRAPGSAPLLLLSSGLIGSTVPWLLGFQAIDLARGTGFLLWLAGAFVVYAVFWSASLH
ncbi:MAG: hypothetical protein H0X68_10635, partial [Chloroflexi bacterium]|nr:hypothetical protein [Chloroflexota bacterium]